MRVDVVINLAAFRDTVTRQATPIIQSKTFDLLLMFPEEFNAPKTGRIYRRPSPLTGTYRASAPGEPPAIQTGNLSRSIRASFPDPLIGQITISADYARLLEQGTSRMAARPYIRPAIAALLNDFNRIGGRS